MCIRDSTNGIDGVHRFLKKLWNLFYRRTDEFLPVDSEPTKEELKDKELYIVRSPISGTIDQFSGIYRGCLLYTSRCV